MRFELDPETAEIRDLVREVARRRVIPAATAWDRAETLPRELCRELGGLGLLGVLAPESSGGSGLGMPALVVLLEELARGDGALALAVAMHNLALGALPSGRAEAGALAQGQQLATAALHDPGAVTVRRAGEAWELSGRCPLVPLLGAADAVLVAARVEGSPAPLGFWIDRSIPGVSVSAPRPTLGMRAMAAADLELEGCLGTPTPLGTACDVHRVALAAVSLGITRAALEEAARYALERRAFGQPIAHYQAIQGKLAEIATGLDAARLLTHRAAWLLGRGRPASPEAGMARLFASQVALSATDEALQIHGGYGYTRDFPVERFWRDARWTAVGAGTLDRERLGLAAGT